MASAAPSAAADVESGPLRATVGAGDWGFSFSDSRGVLLAEDSGLRPSSDGGLGFRTADGWYHATRTLSRSSSGGGIEARVATTDPEGRELLVRLDPDGEGAMRLTATVAGAGEDVIGMGVGFDARSAERFLGFGERSNAVDQRGNEVENFVGEGPYVPEERPLITPFVPSWAYHQRDDATYFPMPWLLSTGGYGVLIDNTETSYFQLETSDGAWGLEVEAGTLSLHVFAGPTPAEALRRLTSMIGTQPAPADPWIFGPTFHVGSPRAEERERVSILRGADAPISSVETSPQYLPCGAQRNNGNAYEQERTEWFHSQGLAATAYVVPNVCVNYRPAYDPAAASGLFAKDQQGDPYVYSYAVRNFRTSQFDFTAPGADEYFGDLLQEPIDDGFDGWMEDYGEYTPLDATFADGTPGSQMHNLYPVLYHRAALSTASAQAKPVVGFVRSGWTGSARYSQLVWGGDPTTDWGYDGLSSAVANGLSMGLSGVSRWGSDIGGFFALTRQLSPELLIRWIQFGSMSGYMKTRQDGVAVPEDKARPQIWDPEILPQWRRWAKFRTQLYPYLRAADARYRQDGLPLMRHMSLVYPDDPVAISRDDEYMFGPDLLAAPVTAPGVTARQVYLPRGHWVDVWRALRYREAGDGGLAMDGASAIQGGGQRTIPAPLDQLPLLARAGTVLPLLPAEVDTLSSYGDESPDLVTLADRRDEMELIAFPRGSSTAAFNEGERIVSQEGRRRWTLRVDGATARTYHLQASLTTLEDPIDACSVTLDGAPLDSGAWSFDFETGVLEATFATRSGELVVSDVDGGCRPAPAPTSTQPRCGGAAATVSGTPGDDLIVGTRGRDVIVAGSGDDRVRGAGGSDVICLGAGRDRAFGNGGSDRIRGRRGNDLILGGRGADELRGGLGRDRVRGGRGDDLILGGGGPDKLRGGLGRDRVRGGRGGDRCSAERRRAC